MVQQEPIDGDRRCSDWAGPSKLAAALGNTDTVLIQPPAIREPTRSRNPVDGSPSELLATDVGTMGLALGNSAAVQVLADFPGGLDLATDATHVYFVSDKLSTVRRVEK